MMKILDLFCGAGGASEGYHRSGFEVVGIDINPQPHFPFTFIQGDALNPQVDLQAFDVIHASPPCQAYSIASIPQRRAGYEYPDLVAETRQLLASTGKPYIIENVPLSPLVNPILLCGTMFGLLTLRHRLFETHPSIWFAPHTCNHYLKTAKQGRKPKRYKEFITVTGHFSDIEYAREAMGIDWMTGAELSQAIPPAYTEWIGKQMLSMVAQNEANNG